MKYVIIMKVFGWGVFRMTTLTGLLPDTQNRGCAGNAGNVFPATDFKGNR